VPPSTGRVLLFTGKGGVGKTTVAAATALRCADAGARTLVLSTDPAHSLSDSFERSLAPRPTLVDDNLYGQQLDATERFGEVWADVQEWLVALLDWAGMDAVEAEELSIVPGLEEIFALADIRDHASSGQWDVIVVDCGPTAETIRLLSLPDILEWYMERVFPVERTLTRVVRPLMRKVTSLPVAGEEVFESVRRFYDRLEGVRSLLTDADVTSVRLVVNPERMVIAEARRTATYLSLFGYQVDAVIANRLLPEAVSDPWFAAWKDAHAAHLAAIEAGFAPLPVLRAELAAEELVGLDRLRAFAEVLHDDRDPAALLHRGATMRIERRGQSHVLRLPLPFADRHAVELGRRDGELLVRVGSYRRAVVLPDSLRRREVTGATMVDGWLEIGFEYADGDGSNGARLIGDWEGEIQEEAL
jgi:arsenite/tail-anchored protein-transporting ATPase